MGRSGASEESESNGSDDSKDSDWNKEKHTSRHRAYRSARRKTGTQHRGKKVATTKKIPTSNKHDTDTGTGDDDDDGRGDDEVKVKPKTGKPRRHNKVPETDASEEETCAKCTSKGNRGGRKIEAAGGGGGGRSKSKSKGKAHHNANTIDDEDNRKSSGDDDHVSGDGVCRARGGSVVPKAKRPKLDSESRSPPPPSPIFQQNQSAPSSSCTLSGLSASELLLSTPKFKHMTNTSWRKHIDDFSECASVIVNATVIPFFPGITELHVHWNPSKKWEKVKGASEAELYALLNKSIKKWEEEISKKRLSVPNQLHDVHTTKVILQDRKPDYVFCLRGKPLCSFYTTFILELTSDEGGSFPSTEYKGRAVDHATKFLDAVPMRTQIWVGVTNLRFIWFLRATRGSGTQKEFCTGVMCAPVAPELLKVLNLSEEDLTGVSLSHSYQMADDPIVIHGRAGEGATSLVMLCSISRPHTEAKYILKIAKKGEESYLQDENGILRHFVGLGIQGVPKTLGLTNGDNAMLIEPIGRSILDTKVLCLIINNIPLLFSEVVKTLEAVHTKGMYVHRDVRPENIILDSSTGKNRLILIDWGFAKSTPCNSEEGFCGTVH
ncbi:hypothetical protein Pelo_4759 [Pelomyxa schiedti]|nr:hypothetical protein Pelo_4759 [Pelomyxa schiedti]